MRRARRNHAVRRWGHLMQDAGGAWLRCPMPGGGGRWRKDEKKQKNKKNDQTNKTKKKKKTNTKKTTKTTKKKKQNKKTKSPQPPKKKKPPTKPPPPTPRGGRWRSGDPERAVTVVARTTPQGASRLAAAFEVVAELPET